MQRSYLEKRFISIPDLMVLMLIGTLIYIVNAIGSEWHGEFRAVTYIDLSISALPKYTILSAARGFVAYFMSLAFTLVFGYWAGKSKAAERFIIPLLDIGQSIPALGFLPGLLLGLMALFPGSNLGLELSAILIIFTSQVWNMSFSLYGSIKSIPTEFIDASAMIGMGWFERLKKLELPFAAVDLAWNSVVSMAGGWFFLGVAEAFTLGEREYRLPGIGSYMAVAINQGDHRAMISGIIAMVLLIVIMDFVIWRPILAWVRKYRLEQLPGVTQPDEPLMRIVIRESKLVRWLKLIYRQYLVRKIEQISKEQHFLSIRDLDMTGEIEIDHTKRSVLLFLLKKGFRFFRNPLVNKTIRLTLIAAILGAFAYGSFRLLMTLVNVSWAVWVVLLRNTLWSLLRVFGALVLATLWTVPVGVWIGISQKRIRIAQPIIQVLAAFPAPMLYPLVVALLFKLGIGFDLGSMFLMQLGVQWYVLFNVLAGALRIPMELDYALSLMKVSAWTKWKSLYLPSIFPNLISGWVIGAGGAWNASIVAEYLFYDSGILKTAGLGSTITAAAAAGDFEVLAASLTLMVAIVLILNRGLWAQIYHLAQTRFKLEG